MLATSDVSTPGLTPEVAMSNLLDNVASAVGGLENLPDHQLLEFATRCGMEFSIREETRASLRCLRMILDGIQITLSTPTYYYSHLKILVGKMILALLFSTQQVYYL